MDDQSDSRTAVFSLKRPHAEASRQEPSGASAASTPRKRAKRRKRRSAQDLDNVLPSTHNPESAVALESNEHDDRDLSGAPHEREPTPDHYTAPKVARINWNTGSKTQIRVALRRPHGKIETASMQEQTQPIAANYNDSQADVGLSDKDTETAYHADTADALAEGRRLVIGNLPGSATESDIQDLFKAFSVCNVKIHTKVPPSVAGHATLDLANPGSISQAIEQLHGIFFQGSNLSIQLAQESGKDDENPFSEPKRDRMQYQESSHSHDRTLGKTPTSEEHPNNVAIQLDPSESSARSAAPAQESRMSGVLEDGREYPARSNHPRDEPTKKESSYSQDEREVIINILDDSDYESGQVTDSGDPRANVVHAREDASVDDADEQSYDSMSDVGDSGLVDEDAMIKYADSKALDDGSSHRYALSTTRTTPVGPRLLADLGQEELELQLRYFYVGKARNKVALSEPIRCLVCTGTAHVAAQCNQLVCSRCGDQNAHSSTICPLMTVCSQCKEPGHIRSDCLSKVKKPHEIAICELCERQGHVSHECELRWRTSGRPWESNLEDRRIRFGCYECGRSGHLGNDCPSRQPGKPKGSSSWTYFRGAQEAAKPSHGISIKGRARRDPITIDDSDDSEKNFYRPRIGAPSRPSNIRISTRGGQQSSRPPLSHDTSKNRDGNFQDIGWSRENRDGRAEAGYAHHTSYGSTNTQPPLPQGPPPYRPLATGEPQSTGTYHPMPSAGRQAWKRFRM
ncbi:MAG: hypothetical protein Q9202_004533 [Teloschistes flavicans]